MTVAILLAFVLAGGVFTIVCDYRGRWKVVYVVKPLTMAAVMAIALLEKYPHRVYQIWILGGLGCSVVGDVFLMLRRKRFLEGLASFLAAHVCYIVAFLSTMTFHLSLGTLLPFLVYALFIMRVLFPYAGSEKAPLAVYIAVIMVMAALAAERFIGAGGTKALFAFIGAMLFVVSDSVLAANRFVRKFSAAQAVILSAYFAAQAFIALSV